MAASRRWPARATWSSAVSTRHLYRRAPSLPPEAGDRVEVLLAQLGVRDAQALVRREHEYTELALVLVVVHLQHGVGDLLERERRRQHGMDAGLGDQPVRLPRLPVVREVAALQRLLVHPEVAVVVLDHEAGGRGAGDDRPAARADEHRRT